MRGVIGVDPAKALPAAVALPECGALQIEVVQLGHELLEACVHGIVEQEPLELLLVGPLAELAELAAHKEQLLAGMGHHIGQIRPRSRKLLLVGAVVAVEQGELAVHDLVV